MSKYFLGNARNNNETKFLRISDGGVQIRLIEAEDGYPEGFEHWVDALGKSLACSDNDCPLCAIHHPRRRRVMLGVISRGAWGTRAMVLDAGEGLLRALDEVGSRMSKNGSNINDYMLNVFRSGEGYNVTPGDQVNDVMRKAHDDLVRNNPLDLEKFLRKVDMTALRQAAGVKPEVAEEKKSDDDEAWIS
jgi:hypothetical protein